MNALTVTTKLAPLTLAQLCDASDMSKRTGYSVAYCIAQLERTLELPAIVNNGRTIGGLVVVL